MIGIITSNTPASAYSPSPEVTEFTKKVRDDYFEGVRILQKPWLELNYESVDNDESKGKKMFNSFVDTSSEDPREDWRWKGTRSSARNKAIAMHAQLTSNYILPLFIAQNEEDEVDRDFSEVMRDIIDWMAQPSNSNYQPSYLQAVFGMMYNPVTYLEADWYEVMQKLSKAYGSQERVDDILSGFKVNVYGPTQILINNAYERNIQKQKCIIKRRYIDYSEAKARWKDHSHWDFVKPGIKTVYNDDDSLFYDIKDEENPNLVSEEIYLNRREDIEVHFLGGVYMGKEDVDNNPIRHRDNENAPKYNVVPFGYSRIGDHFFYYKSLMNVLKWDDMRIDAMDEIIYNRGLLDVDMPLAVSGTDKVDSEVIFPKSVVTFEDKDAKVQPLLPPANLISGFRQLEESQQSASESSVDPVTQGQLPEKEQKVGNVSRAQAQAKKLLSGVGKNLAESMIQLGDLMKDIAIRHITVPQVQELVSGTMKLKYRNLLLENKVVDGKMQTKSIKFDESLIGKNLSREEAEKKSLKALDKLMEEEGAENLDKLKKSVVYANPELFAKFKFLTKIDIEEMFSKNQEYMQPLLTNLYTLLRQDPLIEGEGLLRKLLYSFFQSSGEELIKEEATELPVKAPNTTLGSQAQNKATAKVAETVQ